jgi:uncharacterized protein
LKPGEFGEFNISVGPLPKDAPSITFKALQTYSNGEVVRWIDIPANGEKVDHPAPVLTLTAAATTTTTTPATTTANDVKKSDVNMATALSIVALVLGGAALALVIANFLTRKRS